MALVSHRWLLLTVAAITISGALSAPASAQDRNIEVLGREAGSKVALVIGNSDYEVSPLRNPRNDARDMAAALDDLGFDVIHLEDQDHRAMKEAVRDFTDRLKRGEVGLFYYAGHGVQVEGRNYLVPVGADIRRESDVEFEALDANWVLAEMENAGNPLNMVILDACRNNPFPGASRSGTRGLATMNAPSGSLVAYATAPGSVADDGSGRNGLYTQELLRHIRTPGLQVEDVFKRVRVSVMEQTGADQTPWESSSLTGDFYFVPPEEVADGAGPGQGAVGSEPEADQDSNAGTGLPNDPPDGGSVQSDVADPDSGVLIDPGAPVDHFGALDLGSRRGLVAASCSEGTADGGQTLSIAVGGPGGVGSWSGSDQVWRSRGLQGVAVHDVVVGGDQCERVWVAGDEYVFRLGASGRWERVLYSGATGSVFRRLAPDPWNPDHLLALESIQDGFRLYDTRDGGESWRRVATPDHLKDLISSGIMNFDAVDSRLPVEVSPRDPELFYFGTNQLNRFTDGGKRWDIISPQLGTSPLNPLSAIAPSPHDRDVIWVGSSDGLVHTTRDGGATWQNVTPPDAPEGMTVTEIDAWEEAPGVAWVMAMDSAGAQYRWKSESYGQTWQRLAPQLPATTTVLTSHRDTSGTHFLVTGSGIYRSGPGAEEWTRVGGERADGDAVEDLTTAGAGDELVSTAEGALRAAAVGGPAGSAIGDRMDAAAAAFGLELERARVERLSEGLRITFPSVFLFELDSRTLRSDAVEELGRLADLLDEYEDFHILVVGHSDDMGSAEYNRSLSLRRAQSVGSFLRSRGLDESRMRVAGRGEMDPVATNETAVGRQANRRVEVAVYAGRAYREELKFLNGGGF